MQTLTNTTPVGQFYAFELKTAADAPTGDWNATALVGGASFGKTMKIETVMPNRLKIDLAARRPRSSGEHAAAGRARCAVAVGRDCRRLRAAMELQAHSHGSTRFTRNADYRLR